MSVPAAPRWCGPRPAAASTVPQWTIGDPCFSADSFDRDRRSSPWAGHRWFAYDLMRVVRPRLVVELGTHFGCSFFAMCQAAVDHQLESQLVAVDTWKGDPHAGFYDDSVFELFDGWRREHFGAVSTRALRMTFDDARAEIEPGTVDLLHIDGLHTYEAVSHDFRSWRDRLAPTATVLFHDVAPDSGYESSRFWDDVSAELGGFQFFHSFGLGVVTFDPGLAGLLSSAEFATLARYYPAQAAADLRAMRIEDDSRMLEARQVTIEHQDMMIANRDEALAAQTRLIDAKQEIIDHQDVLVAERDEALATQARVIDAKQEQIEEQNRVIADQDRLIGAQARQIDDLTKRSAGVR